MSEYGEPWKVVTKGNTIQSNAVETKGGGNVCTNISMAGGKAPRIVACVNACADVGDSTLATLNVAALLREREEMREAIKAWKRSRSPHVAALDTVFSDAESRLAALVKENANG